MKPKNLKPTYSDVMRNPAVRKQLGTDVAGLHYVRVLHDDWCDLLNGKGECNCDFEIERVKPNVTAEEWMALAKEKK